MITPGRGGISSLTNWPADDEIRDPPVDLNKLIQGLVQTLKLRRSGAISRRVFLKRWGDLRAAIAATPEYKRMRSQCAVRAKGICQVEGCGRKGELIHHMRQVSKAPELVMDEKNILWICKRCHKKIHPHLQRG